VDSTWPRARHRRRRDRLIKGEVSFYGAVGELGDFERLLAGDAVGLSGRRRRARGAAVLIACAIALARVEAVRHRASAECRRDARGVPPGDFTT